MSERSLEFGRRYSAGLVVSGFLVGVFVLLFARQHWLLAFADASYMAIGTVCYMVFTKVIFSREAKP